MFTRISPVFTIKHADRPFTLTASTKRPVLYIYYDDSLYEMSLITRGITLIDTFDSFNSVSLACDINDDLYVHGSIGCGSTYDGYVYRLTYSPASGYVCSHYMEIREDELKKLRYPIYYESYWHRNGVSICISQSHDRYYFENAWRFALPDGPFGLTGKQSLGSRFPSWIAPYANNEHLIYIQGYSGGAQLLRAYENTPLPTLSMIWISSVENPKEVVYSLVTKEIYGFSRPLEHSELRSPRNNCSEECYISVFNHEVMSLFNRCANVIQKNPALKEQVPPYIREKIDESVLS